MPNPIWVSLLPSDRTLGRVSFQRGETYKLTPGYARFQRAGLLSYYLHRSWVLSARQHAWASSFDTNQETSFRPGGTPEISRRCNPLVSTHVVTNSSGRFIGLSRRADRPVV